MTENASPASTARPSDWSAPNTESTSAAPIAIAAASPTPVKWIQASIRTWCSPPTSRARPGSTATGAMKASAAGRGTATSRISAGAFRLLRGRPG